MELSEAEYECICWYRQLSDKDKLAVRRYVYLDDAGLLPVFGQFSERLNCLRRLAIAKRNNKSALFGT